MRLYSVTVCYNARQYGTIQYNTIQYNNTNHSKSQTTHKATFYTLNYIKKNQGHIYYTLLRLRNE